MELRNLKVIIEYDGTNYYGFQRQLDVPTIQGVLESTLKDILKEKVQVIGAGRTDAGVHATGQVINFKTTCKIPTEKICIALNSLLPPDIVAKRASQMPLDFHARYSAKSKIYRYTILNRNQPSALLARYSYFLSQPLDLNSMQIASQYFLGEHDFEAFSIGKNETKTFVRNVFEFTCRARGRLIYITIHANGFLQGMARLIVGALIKVGLRKMASEEVKAILEAKNRSQAPPLAPPQGLCLVKVKY